MKTRKERTMREATITRKTAETDIELSLNLDGRGENKIKSGLPFMDHMLTLLARHGAFDLTLNCEGDIEVDGHHSVEDIGICLGQAFKEALGDKRGICRYGSVCLPMDEALILCALDFSGRAQLEEDLRFPSEKVGSFDSELVPEFLIAFSREAKLTLHIRQLSGRNTHHIVEACFKALGRALKAAVAIDPADAERIPSTKGCL
jgi:imidazoleglycerol-phosphate dehydratase